MKTYAAMMEEHAEAAQLFFELHRLRRIWGAVQLPPPLKRGDVAMMVMMMKARENKAEEVTVGGLAKMLRQSPAAVSQRISVLEKQGFVTRTIPQGDRRIAQLELTGEGSRVIESTLEFYLVQLDKAVTQMGSGKVETLLGLMHEMMDNFEDVLKGVGTL